METPPSPESSRSPTRSIFIQASIFLGGFALGGVLFSGGISLSSTMCGIDKISTKEWNEFDGSTVDSSISVDTAMFDEMQRKLYDIAIEIKPSVTRRQYTLGDVKDTGGGLTNSDREILGRIYFNATSVFEFGLGESTMIAAHVGVPRYAGVDSDAEWVAKARDGSKMDHFRFSFADTGNTGAWGYPTNNKLQKIPYNYQVAALSAEMEPFDVYLVDGRYRVACACASMLHAMSRGGNMSHIMFGVHDWTGRDFYWPVLEVADIVHEGELLRILKLKPDITENDVYNLWERHIWDQRRR